MKVAAIQCDIVWEDPEANFSRLEPRILEAGRQGARLVLLPEMFSTGFSMDTDRIAEGRDGSAVRFLADHAAAHDLWLGGSLPERFGEDERPHNQFVLAGPAGRLHRYAKVHPFSYAGEDEHYAAGSQTTSIEVEGLRVTPFVCYDLRFADGFWGAAFATDLYAVVANWPAARQHHWVTLLQARAIENQAYVIGVNRVGSGGGVEYAGGSLVVDPLGTVLACGHDQEQILVADVDPGQVRAIRARYPFLADR